MFTKRLGKPGKPAWERCRVACFTETPLTQIHLLAKKIEGRAIELEPYGIVFRKEDLFNAGGQPAIYINSYGPNKATRELTDELFKIANTDHTSKVWGIIPLLNAMNERYDFSWEREWRTNTDFEFLTSQIVCIVLPPAGDERFEQHCAEKGIAWISPGWTYEHIVSRLASQQRKTKSIAAEPTQAIAKKSVARKSVA